MTWGGQCFASIRMLGSDSVMLFNDIGDAYVSMPDIYLRSNGQFVFWGRGASAVGVSMEIEGDGVGVVVGRGAVPCSLRRRLGASFVVKTSPNM